MCGFAGVISWSENHRTSRATLARMSAAIAHRGPDGEGIYFNHDPDDLSVPITPERPQVALAFRRLAVLDPTPSSDQPFVSTDGRYVLVFNGEIYNFRELRAELSTLQPDYVWRTHGDTEVLMQSFVAWGERCVDRLNGMFAFAVWDHRERSLFLARDRMGQKPLYVAYLRDDGKPFNPGEAEMGTTPLPPCAVVFGSEITTLVASRYIALATDASSVTVYLQFGCFPAIESVYRGVHQIRPSWRSTVSASELKTSVYWPAPTGVVPPSGRRAVLADEVAIARTRESVRRAVGRQLVSDVPLGCFLSGGIDSSVIAACARRAGPLKTFSIGFDDPRYDESPYAREVAKHLATDHHEFRVTPDVIHDLPALAAVFGEPFGDSSAIPTHYLSRETRKHVTVALSGDGGDELFGGYDRYRAMSAARRLNRATTRLPWRLLAPLARRMAGGHRKSKVARTGRFLATLGLRPEERYSSFMRLFDGDTVVALLDSEFSRTSSRSGPTHHDLLHYWWGAPDQRFPHVARLNGDVIAAMAIDRITYLPDDLLTKTDRCSMLHGLEVRSPFMDHELVGLAAQLTEDQLLGGGKKRMLREAFASELPASVFNRPKMGFAVPIGEWFRGPLRAYLRDHLFASDSFARAHFKMSVVERLVDEHESQRRDHSQRLYALLMLELWWDVQSGR